MSDLIARYRRWRSGWLAKAHDKATERLFVRADYFCNPYGGNVNRWCCWRHAWNRNLDRYRCKARAALKARQSP